MEGGFCVPVGGTELGKVNIALEPAHPDLSLGGLQALRTRDPQARLREL